MPNVPDSSSRNSATLVSSRLSDGSPAIWVVKRLLRSASRLPGGDSAARSSVRKRESGSVDRERFGAS